MSSGDEFEQETTFSNDEFEFDPDEFDPNELDPNEFDPNSFESEDFNNNHIQDETNTQFFNDDEQNFVKLPKTKGTRKTSEVWDYFDLETEHHYGNPVCKNCGQVFSPNTGNSSLERHLNSHKIKLKKTQKQLKQTTLNFQTIVPYSSSEQEAHDNVIVIWIVANQQPFAIVENKYFREMISKFDPRYIFPSRKTIKEMVMRLYEERKNNIIQDLNNIPGKISITSDIWTSTHTNEAYLGITVHYINSAWKLCHFLLDIIPFQIRHTGENIATEIQKVLLAFNLEHKVLGLTTDNASSMIACGKIMKQELSLISNNDFNHYRCAAHILNLAAQQGIKVLSGEITKVRELMSKIKISIKLCDDLRALCSIKGLQYLKPELDVVTRWNSTYHMLQKLNKMDTALKLLIADYANLQPLYPSTIEWKNIKVTILYIIILNIYNVILNYTN